MVSGLCRSGWLGQWDSLLSPTPFLRVSPFTQAAVQAVPVPHRALA
jgi:hypothetical protein